MNIELKQNGIGFQSKGLALTIGALESPRGGSESGSPPLLLRQVNLSHLSHMPLWKVGI